MARPKAVRSADSAALPSSCSADPLNVTSPESPAAVRAQLGRFGFSGNRATSQVGTLSGGERARLALALVTRDAPHMLVLDEPTNHLDIDAREALVHALNAYKGAVILISHDRHMAELVADRLVLVDGGTAKPFDGSIEDYIDFILGRNQPKTEGGSDTPSKGGNAQDRKARAAARETYKALQKKQTEAEKRVSKLQAELAQIDRAMFEPAAAAPELAKLTMSDLSQRRGKLARELEEAELAWLEAGEALETAN